MAYRNREEEKLERREEQTRRDQQGRDPDADKAKRSWKEIDAQRDGTQRSAKRDPGRQKGETPAYRQYKSKLDKLFDGKLQMAAPVEIEVVRASESKQNKPLPVARVEDDSLKAPLSARDRLKAAQTDEEICAAASVLISDGALPQDPDLLLKVLLQSDASLYLPALEALLDALEKGRPKNAKLIVPRLDALMPSLSGHALDLAKGIRSRIGA